MVIGYIIRKVYMQKLLIIEDDRELNKGYPTHWGRRGTGRYTPTLCGHRKSAGK